MAVVLFITLYGPPEATGPGGSVTLADRVAHYEARQALAHAAWSVEMLAAMLYALAGFVLQHRRQVGRRPVPGRVAWTTVSLGAVLLVIMYPVLLGGLPAAASGGNLPLFDALNSISAFLFDTGNVVVSFGLAGVFLGEARPEGSLSKWLSLAGCGLFLVVALAAGGHLLGVGRLQALAPLGLLGYLLTAWLGSVIWRRRKREEAVAGPRYPVQSGA